MVENSIYSDLVDVGRMEHPLSMGPGPKTTTHYDPTQNACGTLRNRRQALLREG